MPNVIVKAEIIISPNPIEGNNINVIFKNKEGAYTLQLIGSDGKLVQVKNVILTNNVEQKIQLNAKKLASGQYQLIVTDSNGNKEILRFIVN